MIASAFSFQGNDLGGTFMMYVPKIIGQKFASADALVLGQIDSLRKGMFRDELLESLKLSYRKNREKMLETSEATVWRDLEWLEQKGIIERTHGGQCSVRG